MSSMKLSHLSNEMLRYRARERISQSELAKRCGVSLQTINSVENGVQHPSKVTVQKILFVIRQEDKG